MKAQYLVTLGVIACLTLISLARGRAMAKAASPRWPISLDGRADMSLMLPAVFGLAALHIGAVTVLLGLRLLPTQPPYYLVVAGILALVSLLASVTSMGRVQMTKSRKGFLDQYEAYKLRLVYQGEEHILNFRRPHIQVAAAEDSAASDKPILIFSVQSEGQNYRFFGPVEPEFLKLVTEAEKLPPQGFYMANGSAFCEFVAEALAQEPEEEPAAEVESPAPVVYANYEPEEEETVQDALDWLLDKCEEGLVTDTAFRKLILDNYQAFAPEGGFPEQAQVSIVFDHAPDKKLEDELRALSDHTKQHFGRKLPGALRQLYQEFGRPEVLIEWDQDGQAEELLMGLLPIDAILSNSWYPTKDEEPKGQEQGKPEVINYPAVPLLKKSEGAVGLVYRAQDPDFEPIVVPFTPDSFQKGDNDKYFFPLPEDDTPPNFVDWFENWVKGGFSPL